MSQLKFDMPQIRMPNLGPDPTLMNIVARPNTADPAYNQALQTDANANASAARTNTANFDLSQQQASALSARQAAAAALTAAPQPAPSIATPAQDAVPIAQEENGASPGPAMAPPAAVTTSALPLTDAELAQMAKFGIDPKAPDARQQLDADLAAATTTRATTGGPAVRGIRNNNPLNIRGNGGWDGQVGVDDSGYGIYATREDGLRAGALQTQAHQLVGGADTLTKVITRHAPPNENNTQAYIAKVLQDPAVKALGIGPNTPINMSDPDTNTAVTRAMMEVESPGANKLYGDGTITKSFNAGLSGIPGSAPAVKNLQGIMPGARTATAAAPAPTAVPESAPAATDAAPAAAAPAAANWGGVDDGLPNPPPKTPAENAAEMATGRLANATALHLAGQSAAAPAPTQPQAAPTPQQAAADSTGTVLAPASAPNALGTISSLGAAPAAAPPQQQAPQQPRTPPLAQPYIDQANALLARSKIYAANGAGKEAQALQDQATAMRNQGATAVREAEIASVSAFAKDRATGEALAATYGVSIPAVMYGPNGPLMGQAISKLAPFEKMLPDANQFGKAVQIFMANPNMGIGDVIKQATGGTTLGAPPVQVSPKLEHGTTKDWTGADSQIYTVNPATGATDFTQIPGGGASGGPGDYTKTGQEFLSSLPPQLQNSVVATAEGRAPYPNPASRAPGAAILDRAVNQYDPAFNAQTYAARQKVSVDLASTKDGTLGGRVASINTAIQHLELLSQAGDALNNGQIPIFNSIKQRVAQELGQPEPTNFDNLKKIVGDEVAKAASGSGNGTGGDREIINGNLSRVQSPEQRAGAIGGLKGLLAGKLMPLRTSYAATIGNTVKFDQHMDPGTWAALKIPAPGQAGAGVATQQPAATPAAATPAPDIKTRVVGKTTWSPNGKTLVWSQDKAGNVGWAPAP